MFEFHLQSSDLLGLGSPDIGFFKVPKGFYYAIKVESH